MAELVSPNTSPIAVRSNVFPAAVASAVFARRGSAWSELTVLQDRRARLRLGGLFRTAWLVALCRSLAERHLSIEQAHARLSHDGSWNVEMLLSILAEAADPASLPFLALAEVELDLPLAAPALQGFLLETSKDHGGTLFLALEAQDSLGLLGEILSSIAQLGLFPVEMHIQTRDGVAVDNLWLAPANRQAPSATDQVALARMLNACLGDEASGG